MRHSNALAQETPPVLEGTKQEEHKGAVILGRLVAMATGAPLTTLFPIPHPHSQVLVQGFWVE
ncbi:hypothetical protein INR49_017337 [Caranx melampygus]|nr:hypothetical protein INR49_017337 [Caranx melampygus]